MSSGAEQLEHYQASLADALRDVGTERAVAGVNAEWRERADAVLELLAASARTFSAEDLRERVGDPPSPAAMGAVFLAASRRRLIVFVEFDRARRVARHSAVLRLWRGAGEDRGSRHS